MDRRSFFGSLLGLSAAPFARGAAAADERDGRLLCAMLCAGTRAIAEARVQARSLEHFRALCASAEARIVAETWLTLNERVRRLFHQEFWGLLAGAELAFLRRAGGRHDSR